MMVGSRANYLQDPFSPSEAIVDAERDEFTAKFYAHPTRIYSRCSYQGRGGSEDRHDELLHGRSPDEV